MNSKAFLYISLFIGLCTSCNSQTKTNVSKAKKDTAPIYIFGTIRDKQTKEPIPFVTYLLFPTDTGDVWHSSVRQGMSDKSGNYKIDITTLIDSTKTIVIRTKYIQYALTHIIIKGKVKKSVSVDIEVMEGSGDFYSYYKIETKSSKIKQIKQIVNVSRGGM